MSEIVRLYREVHADYYQLLNEVLRLSAATHGREVETRALEVGSWLFGKICAHAKAIADLAPQGPLGGVAPECELWDLSSMAVLVRAEVDTYYTFFYIAEDNIDAEIKEFRWLLWDHHSEMHRLKKLQLIGSSSPSILELEKIVADLTEKVKAHAVYLRQEPHVQKKLRNGEIGIYATNNDLAARAHISPSYHKATFMFLSSYVHAYPFSMSQLAAFRAGEDESLRLISTVLRFAMVYLALALRDFSFLMRNQELTIAPDIEKLIKLWCGVAAEIFPESRKQVGK